MICTLVWPPPSLHLRQTLKCFHCVLIKKNDIFVPQEKVGWTFSVKKVLNFFHGQQMSLTKTLDGRKLTKYFYNKCTKVFTKSKRPIWLIFKSIVESFLILYFLWLRRVWDSLLNRNSLFCWLRIMSICLLVVVKVLVITLLNGETSWINNGS